MERRRFLGTVSLYQLDNFAEHSLLLKIQAVRIILDSGWSSGTVPFEKFAVIKNWGI